MNIQFKKGVLELCVLHLLSGSDHYGYQLVNEISQSIAISEGTVYPLLKRLQSDELVTTYLAESNEGPPRKYYRLTDAGEQALQSLTREWNSLVAGVRHIMQGGNNHESQTVLS